MPVSINETIQDFFDIKSLTDGIQFIPSSNLKSLNSNLFRHSSSNTKNIIIERDFKNIGILPSVAWDAAPAPLGKKGDRDARSFLIPRISTVESVKLASLRDKREFGTQDPQTLAKEVMETLEVLRLSVDETREYKQISALKGNVFQGDGTTSIINMYDFFGVQEKVFDFNLSNNNADILGAAKSILDFFSDNRYGELVIGAKVYCDEDFFSALSVHPKIEKHILANSLLAQKNLQEYATSFTISGVTFEEYRDKVTLLDGTLAPLVDKAQGHAHALGTISTFREYMTCPDWAGVMNTIGHDALPYYARVNLEPKWNDDININVETNTIPIITNPHLIARLTMS